MKRVLFLATFFEELGGIDAWMPTRIITRPIRRWGLRNARTAVCLSRYTEQRVRETYGPRPTTVIYPAVDPILWKLAKDAEPAPLHDPFRLLTVARLNASEQYQGHDRVLAALPTLCDILKKNVHYLIVGGGTDEERLRTLAHRYNV